MANSVIYTIRVIDRALLPLKKIAGAAGGLSSAFARTGGALKKFGYQYTSLRSLIAATYGAMIVAFPIKKAVDFEDKMMDIRRIVEEFDVPSTFAKFSDDLQLLGLYLGKTPVQMAKLGYEVAKFVGDRSKLEGYIRLAAIVSRSFDITAKDAGSQLGIISDKMGLSLKEMERFLDAVNYAADRSATSVKNQLQIISRVSTNLKGFRLPPDLAAGWANFADRIKATPRTAAKAIEMFLREVGKLRGGYRKMFAPGADTNKILVEFLEKLKKMPIVARHVRLDKLFPSRVADFINKAVDRIDVLKDSMRLVGNSTNYAGSMMRELEKKLSTAKTAIDRIKVVIDIVAIAIGDAFLPLIKELSPIIVKAALQFRSFVQQHPLLMKIVVGALALITALTMIGIIVGLISIALSTLLSPITLIVLAIAAVVAAFYFAYKYCDKFKKIVNAIVDIFIFWQTIVFQIAKLIVSQIGKSILDLCKKSIIFKSIVVYIYGYFTKVKDVIADIIDWFKKMPSKIFDKIASVASFIADKTIALGEAASKASDDLDKYNKDIGSEFEALDRKKEKVELTGDITVTGNNVHSLSGRMSSPSGNVGMNMVKGR